MQKTYYLFAYEDPGNFRVYYRDTARKLFCIQNEGSWGVDRYVFNACSRDGEPSHPVRFPRADEFDQLRYPPSIGVAV